MSKLGKFLGVPKDVTIEGLGEVRIYPLSVKDTVLFKENPSQDEKMKMSREIVRRSLRDEKDITDDEIDALPLQVFTDLMNEINSVNGFDNDKRKSAIDRIKQAQGAAI